MHLGWSKAVAVAERGLLGAVGRRVCVGSGLRCCVVLPWVFGAPPGRLVVVRCCVLVQWTVPGGFTAGSCAAQSFALLYCARYLSGLVVRCCGLVQWTVPGGFTAGSCVAQSFALLYCTRHLSGLCRVICQTCQTRTFLWGSWTIQFRLRRGLRWGPVVGRRLEGLNCWCRILLTAQGTASLPHTCLTVRLVSLCRRSLARLWRLTPSR